MKTFNEIKTALDKIVADKKIEVWTDNFNTEDNCEEVWKSYTVGRFAVVEEYLGKDKYLARIRVEENDESYDILYAHPSGDSDVEVEIEDKELAKKFFKKIGI